MSQVHLNNNSSLCHQLMRIQNNSKCLLEPQVVFSSSNRMLLLNKIIKWLQHKIALTSKAHSQIWWISKIWSKITQQMLSKMEAINKWISSTTYNSSKLLPRYSSMGCSSNSSSNSHNLSSKLSWTKSSSSSSSKSRSWKKEMKIRYNKWQVEYLLSNKWHHSTHRSSRHLLNSSSNGKHSSLQVSNSEYLIVPNQIIEMGMETRSKGFKNNMI